MGLIPFTTPPRPDRRAGGARRAGHRDRRRTGAPPFPSVPL